MQPVVAPWEWSHWNVTEVEVNAVTRRLVGAVGVVPGVDVGLVLVVVVGGAGTRRRADTAGAGARAGHH